VAIVKFAIGIWSPALQAAGVQRRYRTLNVLTGIELA